PEWTVLRDFHDNHAGEVWSLSMLPDRRRALSGGVDGILKLWDMTNGRLLQSYERHRGEVYSVAVLTDGNRALSGSLDETLILWDLMTGSVIHQIDCKSRVRAVAVSPDGEVAVSATEDKFQAWSLSGKSELHAFDGRGGGVKAVGIAPNGRVISGSDDGVVQVWDLLSGHGLYELKPRHQMGVTSVAVASDSRVVLSGGTDGTGQLWELASGKRLDVFNHGDEVRTVAIAPDGRSAITGGGDGKILKMWNLASAK